MSYLPPSSLYLHEPQPQPAVPEPHPDPHREPAHEAHLEPLRLSSPAAAAVPAAAQPHMYVTAPTIPHTIERIIDQPPPMLPRMPAMGPMGPAITSPQHEPHAHEPQPHVVEHIVEHVVERPNEAPQVVERIVERIIERQQEPAPQVVERIIERMIDRPTHPEPDVTPPAPTPAPVLTSSATPIHAVKGPKDWLVASPPAFLVEEHAEPRRIHVEETQPDLAPEPLPEARHEHREPHHEPRPEVRHEPKHEPRHEPHREPKPVHAARPETETRPAPKGKRHFLHRAHRTVMRHLTRDKSQPPEPGDKELLTMLATAFGAVCVGLMIWGAYNSLPRYNAGGYGGALRADATSPKLKVVSGEYGRGHYEPVRPPRIETPTVLTGTQPPVHLPPPPREQPRMAVEPPPFRDRVPEPKIGLPTIPVERALDALPRRVDPAIFVKANLGETPMIRTWDNLAKYSMMLTALAVAPTTTPFVPTALAQGPIAPPPAVDYSKQIADLSQAVKKLTAKVEQLSNIDDKIEAVRADITKQIKKIEPHDDSELRAALANIKGEILKLNIKLDNLPAAPPLAGGVAPAPANTARIESELVNIKEAILRLKSTDRLAMASPENLPAPTIQKTARIVFVNLYNKDLYLWVNDKKHRVDAQKTITVEGVAPGAANIEVKSQDSVYHRVSPNLVANETYTLTAR